MGLPIFVDEVPEYEARGDNILLTWHGLELFVPINICIKSMLLCEEQLAKSRLSALDKGTIIGFPPRRA